MRFRDEAGRVRGESMGSRSIGTRDASTWSVPTRRAGDETGTACPQGIAARR